MKSNRNLKCTLEEADLIKSYLIKYFYITTSKSFYYNEDTYKMLGIRSFTPKELKQLHKQVKLVIKQGF